MGLTNEDIDRIANGAINLTKAFRLFGKAIVGFQEQLEEFKKAQPPPPTPWQQIKDWWKRHVKWI